MYLQFPTIKGDIVRNAYALKRTAIPHISGLQETKNKLQSIHVFFDPRSLQIASSNSLDIQLHPPALDNVIVLLQMPGNAAGGSGH